MAKMHKLKCTSFYFLLVSATAFLQNVQSDKPNPYKHQEALDPLGKYQLEWEVNWSEKRVIFNVTVETNGYVGFGLSKKGKMSGADIVIGGVDPSGRVYFSDYHVSNTSRFPERDSSQDWILHTGWERDGHTFLSFSRKFETCDEENDLPISNDLLTLIWAYSEVDDYGQYHFENRGAYNAYLLDPTYSLKPSNLNQVFNITEELLVPPKETTYWCNLHKVPSNTKHHIIGFNPIFPTDRDRQHIHHYLLFRCIAPEGIDPQDVFDRLSRSTGNECYLPVEPNTLAGQYCREVIYAWAAGGKETFFPDHVGLPISEGGTEYLLMQVHYDNPNLLSNLRIRSTLEVHYTSELRKNDVGIFWVGTWTPSTTSIFLPPNSLNHVVVGHCAPGCTRKVVPQDGIHVFAGLLHTHISGEGIKALHFRGGKELPMLLYDDNYNNVYQQFRMLTKERTIFPGDQLTIRCTYDTTDRNGSVVAGGFSTRQEMCDGLLYYYNKIPGYSNCLSEIRTREYFDLLGIGNVTWNSELKDMVISSPPEFSGLTMAEYGNEYLNWDIEMRNEIQQHHLTQPQVAVCASNIPSRFESERNLYPVELPRSIQKNSNAIQFPNECAEPKLWRRSRPRWSRSRKE